ncbi:MAG TPA: PDZ domain-containing protein [Acidimicrobiia bacterium]|nr:PDZ domain-containing protein [Acidimicrobiia bacterium]
MRRFLAGISVVLLVGCAAQPPERSPLPDVAEAVPEPAGCLLSVGEPKGVTVLSVTGDGAAVGVLEDGDVITAIEGTPTVTRPQLTELMVGFGPGEEIEIDYVRDGATGSATVTLGTNPSDASRGMIGITVQTAFDQVPPDEADDVVAPSDTARPIVVAGALMLVDPLHNTWQQTGIIPPDETRWVSTSSGFYSVTDADPVGVLDLRTGDPIPDDGFQDWDLQRLIGVVGDNLLLVVTAEIPDQPGFVNLAIAAFDPLLGQTVWVTPVGNSFGIPVAAYGSPDGSAFIAVGADAESGDQAGVALYDSAGIAQNVAGLTEYGDPMGWFSPTAMAFRTDEETVTVYEFAEGSSTAHELPATVVGSITATVGDARHIIAVRERDMLLQDLLDPNSSAPLATNCAIGRAGDPGWGA